MPSSQETCPIFEEALKSFKASLTPKQHLEFLGVTAANVEAVAKKIEEDHGNNRKAQNMARIAPFIKAIQGYSEVLNIFTQTNDLMSFIWGPVCLLLKIASNWLAALDKLLDALENMGEKLGVFELYSDLLKRKLKKTADPQSLDLQEMLGRVYGDVLEIILLAMRIFPRNAIKQIGIAIWPPFEKRLDNVLKKFDNDKKLLESALLAENFAESRKWQRALDEAFTKQEQHYKILAIGMLRQILLPAFASSKIETAREIVRKTNNVGSWLLNSGDFKTWADMGSSSSVLALVGNPGVGKSTLSSIVVDTLRTSQTTVGCQILSAFLTYQEGQNNTCLGALSSLIYQVVLNDWQFYDIIMEKYGPDLSSIVHSKTKLRDILIDVASSAPTFLILDGLDEITKDERRELLQVLKLICESAKTNFKLFLSSRPEPDFLRGLPKPHLIITVTTESTSRDLQAFVLSTDNIEFLKENFRYEEEQAAELLLAVATKSEGMFLYTKLVLAELRRQTCRREVKDAIKSLPRGLEEAYERVFERMLPRCPQNMRAKRILELLLKAKRPLRVAEISQAVMMDDIFDEYSSENELPIPIGELCGSLIEIRHEYVSFVHFSVHEYLLRDDKIFEMKEADIHESIALLCLRHLCMGTMDLKISDADLETYVMRGEYAFLAYAYESWMRHVKESNIELKPITSALRRTLRQFCRSHFPLVQENEQNPPDIVKSCLEAVESYLEDEAKGKDAANPCDIGPFITKINSCLKSLSNSTSEDMTRKLESCYGGLYRCSTPSCAYFTTGFADSAMLERHETKHVRMFKCNYAGCPRTTIGFTTKHELVNHQKSHGKNAHAGLIELQNDIYSATFTLDFEYTEENRIILTDVIIAQDAEFISEFERSIKIIRPHIAAQFVDALLLPGEQLLGVAKCRNWLTEGSILPESPIEAAVQCPDENICKKFLEMLQLGYFFRSSDLLLWNTLKALVYIAARGGLYRNVRQIIEIHQRIVPQRFHIRDICHNAVAISSSEGLIVSPLLFAIYSGSTETINILLENGSRYVNRTSEQDQVKSILYTALDAGNSDAVAMILRGIQSENIPLSRFGRTAYLVLSRSAHGPEWVGRMIQLLEDAGLHPVDYIDLQFILTPSTNFISDLKVLDLLIAFQESTRTEKEEYLIFQEFFRWKRDRKRVSIVAMHLLESGWNVTGSEGGIIGVEPVPYRFLMDFHKYTGKQWAQAVSETAEVRNRRKKR